MTTRYQKQKKRYLKEKKAKLSTVKWDEKSIMILIPIVLLLVLFVISMNIDFKGYQVKANSNWSTICCEIISVKSINNMEQTRVGNRFVIMGYVVKYKYEVDKIIYQDSTYLPWQSIRNKLFINKIQIGDSTRMYYNKINHKESYIDTDLES